MMKKFLIAFLAPVMLCAGLLLLFNEPRLRAGVACSLPFNLQNNTTADATQVMANYNALVTCLTQAAAAGVNSDITALTALSTPITPTQGGTPNFLGTTSTGSANVQVVGSTTPSTFSLTPGYQVTFIAGFSNTGATTLNIAGTGVKNVFRRYQLGTSATVGGEILGSQFVTVVYDGTQYQILSSQPALVGEIRDWGGSLAPVGWQLTDGSALDRTVFASLFSVIGTTFGIGNGTTTFNVPDLRGRVTVMQDTASRITTACANAATLGLTCGNTNGQQTLIIANVPNYNLSVASITASQTGSTFRNGPSSAGSATDSAVAAAVQQAFSGAVNDGAITIGGSIPSGGSGTAFNTVDPSQIVNKIIKY